MATFGRADTTGSSSQSAAVGTVTWCKFAVAAAGTITKVSAYLYASPASNVGMAIYSDNAGAPNTKLAEDSGNVSVSGGPSWVECNLSYAFEAGTYHLAVWGEGECAHYYVAGSTDQYTYKVSETFETWPSPTSITSQFDREVCIYATYTPAVGAASFVPGIMRHHTIPSLGGL